MQLSIYILGKCDFFSKNAVFIFANVTNLSRDSIFIVVRNVPFPLSKWELKEDGCGGAMHSPLSIITVDTY